MTGSYQNRRRCVPRLLVLVTVLSLAAAAAAGCGSSGSSGSGSGGRVTITFDSYTYGQPNPGGAGLSSLLAEFQRTHPSITVHAVSVPVADNLTKVEADTAAGSPPDVAQVGWNNAETVAQTLPVRAFADVAGASAFNQDLAGYDPALLRAAATKDGKIVMLPWLVSTPVLFYNATMFREAGLNPDQPPTTIAQIQKDALAIKAHGVGEGAYIDAINAPGYSDGITQSLVDSVGGSLLTPSGQANLDSPQTVTALSAVQELVRSGAMPAVLTPSAMNDFSAGKLGMLVLTESALPTFEKAAKGKFTLGVGTFPQVTSLPTRTTLVGNGLAILSKDNTHAQAAWQLVQFLTSATAYQTAASEMGYPPLRAVDDKYATQLMLPAVRQLASASPYTVYPHQPTQAVLIMQQEAVEPIVLQGADPGQTLAAAQAKISALKG
jgi:multiple sugar transport system substrate-binding protein